MIPEVCWRKRLGISRSMNHCPNLAEISGNMAASRKITKITKARMVPKMATCWIFPTNPELPFSLASSGRLTKTNPSMTTASKNFSTMIVASEAEIGTPSRRLSTTARSTSPARAG